MDKQYTISELSQKFNLPASTLRYYEEVGILTNVKRDSSGKRIYEEKHFNRLKTICCFKGTGMSIAQLQKFFSYAQDEHGNIEAIIELLQTQEAVVKERLTQLNHDYEHIGRKLHYYNDLKIALENNLPLPNWADYKQKK